VRNRGTEIGTGQMILFTGERHHSRRRLSLEHLRAHTIIPRIRSACSATPTGTGDQVTPLMHYMTGEGVSSFANDILTPNITSR